MTAETNDPTNYSAVNAMLATLVADMRVSLGSRLVGLYLIGSALTEDFDPGISDVDLVAVLSADPRPADLAGLDAIHRRFVERHTDWAGLLELVYISSETLRTFRTKVGQLAVISPGEPLNLQEADLHWLMRWYFVRETGRALYGPSPDAFIPPISRTEFVDNVKRHAQNFPAWIQPGSPGSMVREGTLGRRGQAYAILTMCRALFACRTGLPATKRHAAIWAQEQLPEWSDLIGDALHWRGEPVATDGVATFSRTQAFVIHVSDLTVRSA